MKDSKVYLDKFATVTQLESTREVPTPSWELDTTRYAMKEARAFQSAWPHEDTLPEDRFLDLRDELLEMISSTLPGEKHSVLVQYEQKAAAKWWGLQGIPRSSTTVLSALRHYYTRADLLPSWDAEIAWQTRKIFNCDLDVLRGDALAQVYRGDYKSNSGVNGFTDRRTPGLAEQCAQEAEADPHSYDPAILGQKYERNKTRNIFMDGFTNYFRSARVWKPLHDAIAPHKLAHWGNLDELNARLTTWMHYHPKFVAIEGDAESMDTWMDVSKPHRVSRFLNETKASNEWLEGYYYSAENQWRQPLIVPGGVIAGVAHALFSGLYPTNDLESYWSMNMMFSLVNRLPWKTPPKFGVHYIFVVLGDDTLLLVDPDMMRDFSITGEDVAAFWVEYGLGANAQKQRIAPATAFFCKRLYAPIYKMSVYPILLAANSFVHPRDGSPFAENQDSVCRFCSLWDNIGAHPCWQKSVDYMVQRYPFLTQVVDAVAAAKWSTKSAGFRERVLGEKPFELSRSRTYTYLRAKFI